MMSNDRSGSETIAGSHLLVVGDRNHDLFVLERRLVSYHYRVTTASSGEKALQVAAEDKPDLILLDVDTPTTGGFAVKESLNQADDTVDIPVIFIADRKDMDCKRQAYELGAADFLPKPFHAEELLARIAVALRHQVRQRRLEGDLTQIEEHMRSGGVEAADEEEATDQLEQAMQVADSRKEPLACLHMKVSGLDEMNNPPMARVVLMEVGDILKNMSNPSTDTVTAYQEQGEYLLSAIGMSIQRATMLAEGLRSQVTVKAFSDPAVQEVVKLSIGICGREASASIEATEVLAGAREAVDQAVDAGGDRVVVKRMEG